MRKPEKIAISKYIEVNCKWTSLQGLRYEDRDQHVQSRDFSMVQNAKKVD